MCGNISQHLMKEIHVLAHFKHSFFKWCDREHSVSEQNEYAAMESIRLSLMGYSRNLLMWPVLTVVQQIYIHLHVCEGILTAVTAWGSFWGLSNGNSISLYWNLHLLFVKKLLSDVWRANHCTMLSCVLKFLSMVHVASGVAAWSLPACSFFATQVVSEELG